MLCNVGTILHGGDGVAMEGSDLPTAMELTEHYSFIILDSRLDMLLQRGYCWKIKEKSNEIKGKNPTPTSLQYAYDKMQCWQMVRVSRYSDLMF